MADRPAYSEAPIFRLDSAVWSYISYYALENDLSKLSLLSTVLAQRIKRDIRELKLCWASCRYIDISLILKEINRHPHVTEVAFTSHYPLKPYWTPINWSIMPSQLTSLILAFSGCVTQVFAQIDFQAQLPTLGTLEVSEKRFPSSNYSLRLNRLPSTLVHLRVASNRALEVPIAHFETFPSGLEKMELNFKLVLVEQEIFGQLTHKVPFPTLPSSVRKLSWHQHDGSVYIELAKLPPSLESFEFKSSKLVFPGEFDPNMAFHTILGNNTDLPRLQEFLVSQFYSTVTISLSTIPSSATRVNITLHSTSIASKDDLSLIVPKMTHFRDVDSSLIPMILSGSVASTMLESLHFGDNQPTVGSPIQFYQHPGLKILTLSLPWQVDSIFHSPISLSQLVSLTLPERDFKPTVETIALLPDSLESLCGAFSEQVLMELFRQMRTPPRLPKLKTLKGSSELSAYVLYDTVPPQLESLSVSLRFGFGGFQPSLTAFLQPSALQELDVRISVFDCPSPEAEIAVSVLNALPSKLTSLTFTSNCRLGNHWPVIFPSSLKHLDLRSTGFVNRSERAPIFDTTLVESCVLPAGLETLAVPSPNPFTNEQLPKYLSTLEFRSFGARPSFEYLESRRHPDPELADKVVLQAKNC